MWMRLAATSHGLRRRHAQPGAVTGMRACSLVRVHYKLCGGCAALLPQLRWSCLLLAALALHAAALLTCLRLFFCCFADSEGSGERTARTVRTRMTEGGRTKGHQQRRGGEAPAGLLAASRAGADPVDLLDAGASRQLVQAAGGKARRQRAAGDDGPDFETNAAGQMVIKVCWLGAERRRGLLCKHVG